MPKQYHIKTAQEMGLTATARIAAFVKCGPKNPSFTCDCCGCGLRSGAVKIVDYNPARSFVVGKDCASTLMEQVKALNPNRS